MSSGQLLSQVFSNTIPPRKYPLIIVVRLEKRLLQRKSCIRLAAYSVFIVQSSMGVNCVRFNSASVILMISAVHW